MGKKFNKGEWSEFYAFLKILSEKKLSAADKNLNIIPNKFFIFQKVFKDEKGQKSKIFDLTGKEILILDKEGSLLKEIKANHVSSKTLRIFEKIKSEDNTTFEIDEAQHLLEDLLCTTIKADNTSKADIEAEIYDRISDTVTPLGFSVKSIVGGASTLLNAGKTTNFIYKVNGLNPALINQINSIETRSKVQDRIKAIIDNGGKLEFKALARKEFESNLKKIDTIFPEFMAQMVLDFFSSKVNKVDDLVKSLSTNKYLKEKYGLSYSDYEFKVKNFLHSTALGMVPSKVWDGFTKAHGGYIVVRNDGIVICYHLYNRDEFLYYLYENTKLESASTNRHGYGSLYQEEDEILFNLNLQIRFIK
jgi:hypothetical protein